ncbi:MAG: enkurin domain-containing protein, partial [Muribaculaceae bacterium]|nr:enkurin domain-containing protein [Muribaculaceae bacterium]
MSDDRNLRGVYETLKKEGYTPPEFGVFRTDMFGAAGDSPQSSGPAVQQQPSGTSPQPQSSGSAAASQANAVSGQSRAAVTGETEPVMDTGIFPDVTDAVAGVTDAVAGDGIVTAEAVQKAGARTLSGQKSGGTAGSGTGGSNAVGSNAVRGENRHAGTRLSGAEQLRVAAHELEAAEAAQRISDDSRREKKEAAAYRKMLLENARAMAERNKEGRRRADEEGIDWDAAIAAVEGKESYGGKVADEGKEAVEGKEAAGGKEAADGNRDSRGVVHEDVGTDRADNDAEVSYDELLSPQAAAKKRANDAGSTGRHVSTEEARAMSTEAPRGLYYHKDAGDAAGREPFAADTRVMNDPEDIYVTPAGSGIDPRGASADPIALPEVTVKGSSRSAIMKRVEEMRYLDSSLGEAGETELRARASSDLRAEREEAERRVEQFRTEHPGKWRGMSEDEREALRESMAGEVEFERLASTLDSRMAANRREQERRMAEIEKDVRESLAATPEGRRILAGRDADMDVMRRVDLAAGYDSELRALRQEAWNLGALDEAKAASEGDGGRETVWNFMKGVGRGLRDIAVNPLGLRSMHNDATQLVRVAGKLKRGEELTETEQRAVESHFSRLAADGHYEKSQAGKAGEFTAALAEIAVEFGLNPASGAVRRTLTGIAREVGPAAVRATLMNAPVLL